MTVDLLFILVCYPELSACPYSKCSPTEEMVHDNLEVSF